MSLRCEIILDNSPCVVQSHDRVSKACLAVREVSLSEDDVIQEVDQVKQE